MLCADYIQGAVDLQVRALECDEMLQWREQIVFWIVFNGELDEKPVLL
jgi:hypothetical protein